MHTFEEIKNKIDGYREVLAILNGTKLRAYERARDLYKEAGLSAPKTFARSELRMSV